MGGTNWLGTASSIASMASSIAGSLTPIFAAKALSNNQSMMYNPNTGGFTCLTTYLQSYVEGSFDNNVWSRTNTFLTNAIFPDSSTAVRSYAAIGLYPYVRIHLYTYSTVNCNYAIQYAGGWFGRFISNNVMG